MKINYNFIKSCSFAASKDITREYLCGVKVIGTNDGTTYVATNGHILITVKDKTPNEDFFEAIFPTSSVNKIVAMLPDSKKRNAMGPLGSQVDATLSDNIITLKACYKKADITSISFSAVDGKYPEWERIVVSEEDLAKFEHKGKFTFGFNWGYLKAIQDAAVVYRNTRSKVVGLKMSMTSPTSPAKLVDDEWDKTSSFTAIVMPMKV
jgi:DNA polymerase III sliding clamp (beta) subunit (PCNA family)